MKRENLMVVEREREREREVSRKLGFICDAKNIVNKKYEYIIKRIECHVEKLWENPGKYVIVYPFCS